MLTIENKNIKLPRSSCVEESLCVVEKAECFWLMCLDAPQVPLQENCGPPLHMLNPLLGVQPPPQKGAGLPFMCTYLPGFWWKEKQWPRPTSRMQAWVAPAFESSSIPAQPASEAPCVMHMSQEESCRYLEEEIHIKSLAQKNE
jgi:hypothetical protein